MFKCFMKLGDVSVTKQCKVTRPHLRLTVAHENFPQSRIELRLTPPHLDLYL